MWRPNEPVVEDISDLPGNDLQNKRRRRRRAWRDGLADQTVVQTLEAMRQPPPPMRQRLRNRVAPFTWDRQR